MLQRKLFMVTCMPTKTVMSGKIYQNLFHFGYIGLRLPLLLSLKYYTGATLCNAHGQ